MILPHLPIPLACGVPCAADTAQGDAERVGCSVLTTPGRRQRVVGVSATGVPCLLHAMRGPMAVAAPWAWSRRWGTWQAATGRVYGDKRRTQDDVHQRSRRHCGTDPGGRGHPSHGRGTRWEDTSGRGVSDGQ